MVKELMWLPLINHVVLDGLAVHSANIEDSAFTLHLSEDLAWAVLIRIK